MDTYAKFRRVTARRDVRGQAIAPNYPDRLVQRYQLTGIVTRDQFNEDTVTEVDAVVEVSVDLQGLAFALGRAAVKNKGGKSHEVGGLLVVRRVSVTNPRTRPRT